MGATNPAAAEAGTIRGDLAVEVGRNLIHGSDSLESARREIELFFDERRHSKLPARPGPLGVRGSGLSGPSLVIETNDRRVSVEQLRREQDAGVFQFDCTDELVPLTEFIGQDRALRSLQFGLGVEKPGYNIFVTGLTGTGKSTAILEHIQRAVEEKRTAEATSAFPPTGATYTTSTTRTGRARYGCLRARLRSYGPSWRSCCFPYAQT